MRHASADSKPLLVVTDEALAQLALVRSRQSPRADQALGLVLEPGGRIGLVLDQPDRADRVLSLNGAPVLFVAHDVERQLRDHLMDYGGAVGGERFTLVRVLTAVHPA